MQVLGYKYRQDFGLVDFFEEIQPNKNDKLANVIGYNKQTNLPVNDLTYMQDSRFVDYFVRPQNTPSCPSESVLKPTSVETFAENRQYNNYLVNEISEAEGEINSLNVKEQQKLIDAAKNQLKQETESSKFTENGSDS